MANYGLFLTIRLIGQDTTTQTRSHTTLAAHIYTPLHVLHITHTHRRLQFLSVLHMFGFHSDNS